MTHIPGHFSVTKNRAVIHKTLATFTLGPWSYFGMEPDPPIPQSTHDDFITVEVGPGELAGLTLEEFQAQKKPVMAAGALDHWADRDYTPTLALAGGTNPTANGGIATIEIRGGEPNAVAKAEFSRDVDCDMDPGCLITLDGNGDGDVQFRVYGLGDLSVVVRPNSTPDFKDVSLVITVDAGSFP